MAGRIAYFLPFEELLYAGWDPFTVLFIDGAAEDPETRLPPRLKTPRADWFDPNMPAKADPAEDWFIQIVDGRFVGAKYKVLDKRNLEFIYADLRNDGSMFVVWLPFHEQRPVFDTRLKSLVDTFDAKWDQANALANRLDRNFLKYKCQQHDAEDDPLRIAAEAPVRSPLFETSINVTLAVRKALRRYLGIEPAEPDVRIGEPE